jgi:hypothetical protein
MALNFPGINCYCNFCGNLLRFQIARAGETVNCFNCTMETVLFIPGLQPPYPSDQFRLEARDCRWSSNQFGTRHVAGAVENKSAKHLDWVRVEFILYDRAGLPVGSTSDCLMGFAPGALWKFQTAVSQLEAVHISEPILSCEYGRVPLPVSAAMPKPAAGANGSPRLSTAVH